MGLVPWAQCQQPATTITQQLKDGVRFLDLRMRVVDGELLSAYILHPPLTASVLVPLPPSPL